MEAVVEAQTKETASGDARPTWERWRWRWRWVTDGAIVKRTQRR